MKIIHAISGLGPGGAEHMLCRLIEATPQLEHVVISLSRPGPLSNRLHEAGVTLIERESGWAQFISSATRAFAGPPDVIQGWMYHGNLAALAVKARYPHAPLLWNVRQSIALKQHTKPFTRFLVRLQAGLSRFPRAVIYNSAEAANAHERVGFSADRTTLIGNGFDTDEFKPDPKLRVLTRKALEIDDHDIAIGLVARFDPWKNHEGFFRVADELLASRPECRFILAGKGIEWTNDALIGLMPSIHLRKRTILLGDRRDVHSIYAGLDVACNVSHGEGFPNAVGEAMACALPCVVTPVGATPALVGDCGIVAQSASDDSILRALQEAMAMRKAARERLGKAARMRIEAEFSIKSVARKYVDLYSRAAPGMR